MLVSSKVAVDSFLERGSYYKRAELVLKSRGELPIDEAPYNSIPKVLFGGIRSTYRRASKATLKELLEIKYRRNIKYLLILSKELLSLLKFGYRDLI